MGVWELYVGAALSSFTLAWLILFDDALYGVFFCPCVCVLGAFIRRGTPRFVSLYI